LKQNEERTDELNRLCVTGCVQVINVVE